MGCEGFMQPKREKFEQIESWNFMKSSGVESFSKLLKIKFLNFIELEQLFTDELYFAFQAFYLPSWVGMNSPEK